MSATSFYNKSGDSVISSAFSDDTDSFIIGDRVWVQGTKAGYIQYIGEVQFAKGQWAGVVLDKPEGKNDGSVHGVRYFQCEPYRGLFTRLHRLSRFPLDINGNRLPIEDIGLVKTRRVCTPDGRVTVTTTRVTKAPASIPHYALPTRPAKVITTVTTTTTTSVQKPKSVLKSSCRVTSNGHGTPHHVHF